MVACNYCRQPSYLLHLIIMQKTKLPSRQPKKRTVVIVASPNTRLLDIAGPGDVFSIASNIVKNKPGSNTEGYEVLVASATKSKQVVTSSGIRIVANVSLMDIDFPVDTLLIGGASFSVIDKIPTNFYSWIADHYKDIRRMGSVCVGAFVLARAGLLDNKCATTHWEYCARLKEEFPTIKVDNGPFYVNDGKVYTSGGLSSGIDLSLALVEEDLGRDVALQVARKLVLHLKRTGSQLQFSNLLITEELKSPLVSTIRHWLQKNLDKELRVEQMAEQASMSPRNFARVFLKETMLTPAKFVEKLRVDVVRQYLEDTDLSMEQIAERCGLDNVVSMRRVFLRHLQLTPSFYRHSFRTALTAELA